MAEVLTLVAVVVAAIAVIVAVRGGRSAGAHLRPPADDIDLRSRIFEDRVGGLSGELQRLGELVQVLQRESAHRGGATEAALRQVVSTQSALAAYTHDLHRALAGPKQRGQWGERMAEDVLRAAGFQEGVNYRRQPTVAGGSVPDISFLLPNDLEVRMDVKFPIDNHLRALDAATDEEISAYRKAFVRDVRSRIRELASRRYRDPTETVDCVLLFIPNESIYAALHEADPDVLDVAMADGVVLCSPSTLFAVLAVIRRAVEQFELRQVSDDILRCLAGVVEQWGRFTDQLDVVERRLAAVGSGFDELQGVRRRQMERSLAEVDRLRADADFGGDDIAPHPSRSVRMLAPVQESGGVT